MRVQLKCHARIARLADLGHELRRPEADYLRDGIYELRSTCQGIHYRLLYFFAGQSIVVLSHGFKKEREVPSKEIDLAIKRKNQITSDFQRYTFSPKASKPQN
jgi:phage-related protein